MKRKYIEENLELIGDDFLSDFTEALIEKDTEKTLKNLVFLREKSLDVRLFLEQFLFFLRDRMKDSLKKEEFGAYAELFEIFEGIYGRLKFSPDPFLLLETSAFRCIAIHPVSRIESPSEKRELGPSPVLAKKVEKVIPPTAIEAPLAIQKQEGSISMEKPATPFDFSRFIEHIRTVPKRSFVGL